eukprot:GHVT01028322.1.p1 GENE.GHVT01028322.1~~GHVT01028322.1.p1  ORF type:complete len:709 (+),score=149.41 GHVT01028322.1:445-2571(+)
MAYLSEDSDEGDVEILNDKFQQFEPLVQLDETFPNVVAIQGVPEVPAEKLEKLETVLKRKIQEELQKKGGEVTEGSFSMTLAMTEDGATTKGLAFVSFSSGFAAQHAARHLTGFSIDKKHKFRACMLDDFAEIVSRDANYKQPIRLLGFTRENQRWWMHDPRSREQFVVRYKDETEIHWHDPVEHEPVLVYNGERQRVEGRRIWTDFKVQWSPQGSYLATFHRQGVAVWAGELFEKKCRMEHKDVKCIDFSPNEEYMLSWDGSPENVKNERAIKVFRVMTAELLRSFSTPSKTPRGNEFPHFLWSHNDNYVARLGERELCVYQLPEMSLCEDYEGKKSTLKYPAEKFDWSPTAQIISVWIPTEENLPGRLVLVEIPSRKELASKNVYNVQDASMHWQSKGDYMCLRTAVFKKTSKKGRREFTQLEIFRMREKDIPVDNLQIEDMAVKQLHWDEGFSKRFALIVQEKESNAQAVRLYRVSEDGARRDTVWVSSLQINYSMNFMRWSPSGGHFILAALGPTGTIMFCHFNDKDEAEVMQKEEHYMVNDIRWSSCGRYVTTAVVVPMAASGGVPSFGVSMEAGFRIWTFLGKCQYRCQRERFFQFQWRPRPPSLLKREKLDAIRRGLKDLSKRYDADDEALKKQQREAQSKVKKEHLDAFQTVIDGLLQWQQEHKASAEWQAAWSAFTAQFEYEDKEETSEELLNEQETII